MAVQIIVDSTADFSAKEIEKETDYLYSDDCNIRK